MNRTCCVCLAVVLLGAMTGCQMMEREQLEEERKALQSANDSNWQALDRLAPIGSRWSSHQDTQPLLSEMKSNSARIREIDAQLAK